MVLLLAALCHCQRASKAVFILGIHRVEYSSPKIIFPQKPIKFFLFEPRIIHCYKKLTIKRLFNFDNFNSRLPASSQHHTKYFNPKRHILAWFRAFWAITRQNRSKRLISARASEKNSHKKVTFHLFVQKSPVNRFLPNLERTFPWWTKSTVTNFVTICLRV